MASGFSRKSCHRNLEPAVDELGMCNRDRNRVWFARRTGVRNPVKPGLLRRKTTGTPRHREIFTMHHRTGRKVQNTPVTASPGRACLAFAALFVVTFVAAIVAQGPATVWDGVYTAEQATRGARPVSGPLRGVPWGHAARRRGGAPARRRHLQFNLGGRQARGPLRPHPLDDAPEPAGLSQPVTELGRHRVHSFVGQVPRGRQGIRRPGDG